MLIKTSLSFSHNQMTFSIQIWVYGNSFESFLVAVINPNMQAIENWAQSNGITGDFKALCENPKVKEYILGQVKSFAKEKKVFFFFNSYWPSVITLVAMLDHQKRHKHTQSC